MSDNRKPYVVNNDNTKVNHALRDEQLTKMRKAEGGKIKRAWSALMRKVKEADEIGGVAL